MKKYKGELIVIAYALGLALVIGGLGWANYEIWRLKHPEAPTWTYFIGSK